MVRSGRPGMVSDALAERIRGTLTPDGGATPCPSVVLHLRRGAADAPEWAALERFLELVRFDDDARLMAGFFNSGGSEAAKGQLQGEPYAICLHRGTDWDWMVWETSIGELRDLHRDTHTWPDLLFPVSGGWMLETPPSDRVSFLYPLKVPA